MNYEKLSVIKTGSNAGLYAKCYFHMQVMYHNLFSFYVLFGLNNIYFIKYFNICTIFIEKIQDLTVSNAYI